MARVGHPTTSRIPAGSACSFAKKVWVATRGAGDRSALFRRPAFDAGNGRIGPPVGGLGLHGWDEPVARLRIPCWVACQGRGGTTLPGADWRSSACVARGTPAQVPAELWGSPDVRFVHVRRLPWVARPRGGWHPSFPKENKPPPSQGSGAQIFCCTLCFQRSTAWLFRALFAGSRGTCR